MGDRKSFADRRDCVGSFHDNFPDDLRNARTSRDPGCQVKAYNISTAEALTDDICVNVGLLGCLKRCPMVLVVSKAIEGIHKAAYKPISDGSWKWLWHDVTPYCIGRSIGL